MTFDARIRSVYRELLCDIMCDIINLHITCIFYVVSKFYISYLKIKILYSFFLCITYFI